MTRIRGLGPLVALAALGGGCAGSRPPAPAAIGAPRVEQDLEFAGQMAEQGLWREAIFRWERALESRPGDSRLLNNIAVAHEALGEWDQARASYEQALAVARDPKIEANYQLYRQRQPQPADAGKAEGTEPEAPDAAPDRAPDEGSREGTSEGGGQR
ncbi:MAG: tetratricopeptide repeat protein [Acidobacteria bacterium]|nr:tetratricopeptide repeat protein [Acidobacteriota bacterium]